MISILMPLYNGVEFLKDSITSVKRQSYHSWELLIGVNGYSEEDYQLIAGLIDSFGDSRIKPIYCEIKSKTVTLNTLAQLAEHSHVALIDVDDYWFPDKLIKRLPFVKKYDVVGSDCAYFGDILGTPGLFQGELNAKMFTYQNPVINSAVILKKEDAFWNREWEGLDDYNLWIHLLEQGKTFYNVPEILINHRIHSNSFFNNKNEDKRIELVQDKLVPLETEEYEALTKIIDDRNWKL